MLTTIGLKERLAALIARASDGAVTAERVLSSQSELSKLGLTSLAQLRVVDAIENDLGVNLDLERDDLSYLDSLEGMVGYLRDQGMAIEA